MRVGKPLPPMPRAPATPIRPPPPCLPPEKGPIPTRRVDRREDSRAVLAVRTMLSPARSDPFTTGHPISLKRLMSVSKSAPASGRPSISARPAPRGLRPTMRIHLACVQKWCPPSLSKSPRMPRSTGRQHGKGGAPHTCRFPTLSGKRHSTAASHGACSSRRPANGHASHQSPPHSPLSLTGRGLPEDGGRRRHSSASNRGIRRGVLGGYPLHHEAKSIGERDHLRVRMSAAL